MNNFYYTLLFFGFSLFVSAQDIGGTPVKGLIPIKRTDSPPQKTLNTDSEFNVMSEMQSMVATTAPTGTSTEVGITEGQLSVSLSGAATYNIPIKVPPGINGVVPQISLAYNSQGGNGMAGYGWNVAGVSKITRIPSTKYHDGSIDPVDFDNLDRFALDGQRLMVKNGTSGVYGANGTEYETESFSNVKIKSYGVHSSGANYGPSYFIVEYPDGSKAYYGNSTDSRSIAEWAITYWENPQGVRINYSYLLSNNILNINTISHGAQGTNSSMNITVFIYKTRLKPEQYYIGGQSFTNDKILDQIQVNSLGIPYRNYQLAYDYNTSSYERLIKVTENSEGNAKSYNPTVFSYDNTAETISYANITTSLNLSNITSLNAGTVSGDFAGDEKMEFLIYPTTGTDSKTKYWLFSNISSGNYANIGWERNEGAFETIFPTTWLSWNNKLMPKQGWTVAKKTDTNYTFTIYSADPVFIILEQYNRVVNFPIQPSGSSCYANKIIPKNILSGDFNGDGLTDVIAVDNACSSKKVYFVDLKRDNTSNFLTYSGELSFAITTSSKVEVADVNGDGKSDFMVFENGKVTCYTLNDANQLVLLWNYSDANISITTKTILLGDYNGDGKTDFIIPNISGSVYWSKYISTGAGFIKTIQGYAGITYLQNTATNTYNYIASDYDKDGKSDLILARSNRESGSTSGSLVVTCYKNTNGAFSSSNLVTATSSNSPDINLYTLPVYLPTGRGIYNNGKPYNPTLEIAFLSNNKIFYFNASKDSAKDQLLKSVTTGNGVKESITYQPLSPNSVDDNYAPIYSPSLSIENYPQTDIESAATVQVVIKLEKQSATDYKKQLFTYYGAVSNLQGLGFLGFRATMRTNWHDDNHPIISSVAKNDINLRGANIENYTALGYAYPSSNTPTTFIAKSVLSYGSQLLANKVFMLKNTIAQQYNGLENTSSETTTSYDAYNNPTAATAILKNGGTTEQTTVNNVGYDNQPTGTTYYIGRPTAKTTSVTASGDTMTGEELYIYTNNLLTQVKKKGNNTNYITEDNVYDSFGNITQKTITATGLTPRITYYNYNPSGPYFGRFLTESTDVEGLKTAFDYNPDGTLKFENKQTELNSWNNAIKTSYEYDTWCKKTKTIDYLGKSNTYAYSRINSVNALVTTTGDDGSYSEELFDDLGRKITASVKDISGNLSSVSYLYDIYDRNVKVSEPYTGSGASQWNETQYDVYGRTIKNIAFTGKTTTASYSGLTTTVNDGAKTKTSVKNAMGNVVSMTDTPGGTINYTYFANGNLKTTTYDGVATTMEQDGWGRKTKLIDPSAGTYTYAYNDLGEILTETTPNGAKTYTLNAVGKLTQKTIVGANTNSTTTYVYDGTTKLPTSSTFVNAFENNATTTTAYTYDVNKRLVSSVETTPYATFTKQLTYDAFGRVDTETTTGTANGKTSSKTIKKTYKNSYPWQMLDNATQQVLWQTNTVNARGQLLTANLGNGIAITNSYDTYGFATQFKHDKTSTGVNIMTLNTVFDPQKGNLTSRTNSLFGTTDNFIYDSLDRLTGYPDALGNTITQSYKEDGRIEANTLGTYNYANNAKKYQNTSVTLSPEATGYYANREGIFDDSMESQTGWDNTGLDPWTVANQATISYDASSVHSGKYALKLSNTTTTEKVIHTNKEILIDNTAPTSYTYSAWVKSDGPQAELFLFMKTETETGYFTLVDSEFTNVTNQWVKIEGTFLVPANIKRLSLRLDINNLGNVWFDDIKIRKTSNTALANTQVPDASYQDHQLNVVYNAFKSPHQIEETGKDKLSFVYNDNNSRSAMFYGSLDTDKNLRPNRKYYSADGSMEIKVNIQTGATEFVTYIGGDAYSAPIVLKSDGTTQNYLYLHRDYQGSILAITDANAAVLEKRLFDAWGAILKVQDGAGNALNGLTILDRGYTGHEHLQNVGLINMNGRLYDPKLHRFLQPDNYVQDPSNTQNYNRYGYCVNNPLKYTDENGEFFSFITGLVEGLNNVFDHGVNFKNYDWTRTQNAWKIDMGLFQGNIGQIISRSTWELPQTLLGYSVSGIYNFMGGVESVGHYGGATVVRSYSSEWGGFTLGSYINGDNSISADPNNTLFQHEYGHYLQSQKFGPSYMRTFALPSLFDTFGKGDHRQHFAEQDANSRAFTYFNEHIENYNGWDHGRYGNPINGYDWSKLYNDVANQLALSNNLTRPRWYRFVF